MKIKFVSIKGRPMVELTFEEPVSSYRAYTSWARKIAVVNDCKTLRMGVGIYDLFCLKNKETCGDIYKAEIDPTSIAHYYGFNDGNQDFFTTKLTENFVKKFCERGSALIRYEPNLDKSVNMLGMQLPEFNVTIYQRDYYNDSCDEDMTEEEAETIMKMLHPESAMYETLANHLSAKKMNNDEIEQMKREVAAFEAELNAEIEKYADEIEGFKETLPGRALDCGFTIVRAADDKMSAAYKKLISAGQRETDVVQINFPDDYMNCSNSHAILSKLRELSGAECLQKICIQTVLD